MEILMTIRHCVRVDVTDTVGTGERLTLAATVFLPEDIAGPPGSRTVLFGYPGGAYNRHYYDLQISGHAGYSQAEHHVSSGHIVVAVDHLAVGDSDKPEISLDFDAVARANAHAAREITGRLKAGTLAEGVPPVEVAATAAVGQSFGGFLLIIAQAAEATFDGIGVLGYSARDPQTPWPANLTLDDVLNQRGGNGLHHPFRPWFHYRDVPEDIVAADLTKLPGTLASRAPWSTEFSPGGPAVVRGSRQPRDPGVVAADAARIEVPVLAAAGEIDVVKAPLGEPLAYSASGHVTAAIVPRMAHMHNFASTRVQLWNLIDDWLPAVRRHAARKSVS
jgi:pimeloyl-ACP methyl ester carboxylesterase